MSCVIDIFKGLVFNGTLETGNATHMECVWLVFIKFLQDQLYEVCFEWNTHYIRRSRHDSVPGLPDVLFFLPDISGHINKIKIDVSESVLDELSHERDIAQEAHEIQEEKDAELEEYLMYVVRSEKLPYPPRNWAEGKCVFERII